MALALAAIAALLVGSAVSAARDYSKVREAAFGAGYRDEYKAATGEIDNLECWKDGQFQARSLFSVLVNTLDPLGELKEGARGYCILTVKIDTDSMQDTRYPGCLDVEGCEETETAREYTLEPDGVWSRRRY